MRLTGAGSPVLLRCGGCSKNAVRRVPIPSELVRLLREHIESYGTAPAVVASPLARKPYDFRHAGVSWRLSAGAPGPQVAEWAGHSVEVLYRIYMHCIDGDDERWHKRMEDFLG